MALKALKVATNEASSKKKSDIVIVDISGETVTKYNQAVVAQKAAEAAVKELGASLKSCGLPELFSLATTNPDTPPSSIKLRDELGGVVRLTSQDRYGVVDPEVVDPVFESLGADINDFVQYTVKAAFDSKVFLAQPGTSAGQAGNFSAKVYNAYKGAIDQVTARLIKEGLLLPETPAPLAAEKVATVKPDFHGRRWRAFPQVAQQVQLSEVISNTVTLTPVVE
jgi:hypothetical protein